MICQIPSRNTKRSGKKKRFCEKMRRKKRKMPILTYQLAWAAFWVACHVKLALQITYLQLWRAACILSTRVYSMRERVKWKVRRTTSKIVALESIIEEDLPTYLAQFDSDSIHIGINTLYTCMLSGKKDHFENLTLHKGQSVKGTAGGLEIDGQGTFVFWIQYDDGQIDTIKNPQSFYMPGLKLPLLSPQYWAETAKDNLPIKFGTKIEADEEGCTLLW
jgi:hypothetical protein